MPKKNSYLTVTDQFCGAGGSSQGVRALSQEMGGGLELKLALNHWALAIETHNTNFPDAIHDCTDISAADPRRYPSTDILITSPECTNHSLAKGKAIVKKQMDLFMAGKADAAAERSRATMWDVPRFAEYHNYNAIIVENVVDARKWVMFDAWLIAMQSLGYLHKCVYLNSMHCHPTPQSRDRMYVVFWKKGNKAPDLEYLPLAHCPKCGKDTNAVQTWKKPDVRYGKYKQQYVYCCPSCSFIVEPYYYAAFNCIDWTDLGTRIGDRPKALSPKTVTRIEGGIKKYGQNPFQVVTYSPGYHVVCTPFVFHVGYGKEARGVVRSTTESGFTQTTGITDGLITPFIVNNQYSSGVNCRVKSVGDKLDTIPGSHGMNLVTPFIVKLEHNYKAEPAAKVLKTQTGRQSDMLISPYTKSLGESLPTQTPCQGMGLVVAEAANSKSISHSGTVTSKGVHHGLVTSDSWKSFLSSYYNGSNCDKHITDEMGSLTTTDRHSIVNFKTPSIEDCFYRMLKAKEVKKGMAFEDDYIILGNSRDQVKQCGNAVTPPAMKWLAGQVLKSLN